MKGFIYCLKDPQSGEVRYIGQTVDVRQRRRAHTVHGTKRRSAGKALWEWTVSLAEKGLTPEFCIIEECHLDRICAREDFHLAKHRSTLLNVRASTRVSYRTQSGLGEGVKCIETGRVFASKAEAARFFGCSQSSMCNYVKTGDRFIELWNVSPKKAKAKSKNPRQKPTGVRKQKG